MLDTPQELPNSRHPSSRQMKRRRRHARRESLLGLLALTVMVLISGALFVFVSKVVAPWSGYPGVVFAVYMVLFLFGCAIASGWDPSTLRRKR
jgi:cobalamin biosynthesis protein CobD/CbiB